MHIDNPPILGRPRNTQRGFTLIELLVTLSIAGVLAALAAPSFQGAIASSRLKSRTNDLVGTLAAARSEAIRRGKRVTVCKSSDQKTCATTGDWEQGWIAFEDDTRASDPVVDTGETILSVSQAMTSGTVIMGDSVVASYVSYAADGRAKLIAGGSQSGTLRICSTSTALTNDQRARDIQINAVGRTTSSTPAGIADTCPAP